MRYLFLFVGIMLIGCSGDTTPKVPENATSAPPEVGASMGGAGESAGKGNTQQLRPR